MSWVSAIIRGVNVEKDDKQAAEWYLRAAEQGHVEAQYKLGMCYKNGEGVEKDDYKAVKWYSKAVEQGHVLAQFWLALCYEKGEGIVKDINRQQNDIVRYQCKEIRMQKRN